MATCNETYKSEPDAVHIHDCIKPEGHQNTDHIPLHECEEDCGTQWFSEVWEPPK